MKNSLRIITSSYGLGIMRYKRKKQTKTYLQKSSESFKKYGIKKS